MLFIFIQFLFREVPGTDVSSMGETDKENEEMDDTDQLLDSMSHANTTTTIFKRSPMKPIPSPAPLTPRNSGADLFSQESDVEATPTNIRIFSNPVDFD